MRSIPAYARWQRRVVPAFIATPAENNAAAGRAPRLKVVNQSRPERPSSPLC